ncbi:MAG: hypothetical protein JWO07_835 [Candidatus Saccharibacteria bacterium]|nr:hypothetical protein [Candidatus Saccharibacteria bacterium]
MTSLFDRSKWVREIHLIGLGGIGSWVALWLLKLGVPEIHVYDDDVVEQHNTFFQLWANADVGIHKVQALEEYARREGYATKIIAHPVRVTEDGQLNLRGVVISGVDSMASRYAIWKHLKFNGDVELYMDGRIGGEDFHLYTLNPSHPSQVKVYEAWLHPDDEATPDTCTERDDFDSGVILSGFILKNLTSFARGKRLAVIYHGDLSIVAGLGGAIPVVQIP